MWTKGGHCRSLDSVRGDGGRYGRDGVGYVGSRSCQMSYNDQPIPDPFIAVDPQRAGMGAQPYVTSISLSKLVLLTISKYPRATALTYRYSPASILKSPLAKAPIRSRSSLLAATRLNGSYPYGANMSRQPSDVSRCMLWNMCIIERWWSNGNARISLSIVWVTAQQRPDQI